MRFGRVEGFVETEWRDGCRYLHLTVLLETTASVRAIRDEVVPTLDTGGNDVSLSWHADQYTQETIGVDLAIEGWEIVGSGEISDAGPGEIARSASYVVRQR